MEIEIKAKVENISTLINLLENCGITKYEGWQIDEYFVPPHRNFLSKKPIKEWLRIRESDGACTINYKNWHYEKKGISNWCDEHESEINNIEELRKIFSALNFKSLVVVNKHRKAWIYGNYEIAIDTVQDLGTFVEVEYIGVVNDTPTAISNEMTQFLIDQCGIIRRDYKGYPYLIIENQNNTKTNNKALCPELELSGTR